MLHSHVMAAQDPLINKQNLGQFQTKQCSYWLGMKDFLAIIKNKNDDKYLLKYIGYSKKGAASEGISKCMEKFPQFTDINNNGCYIHYEKKVTKF